MMADDFSGPLPERRSRFRINSVSYGEDGVQVEIFHLIGFPVRRSCCIFYNNSLPIKFSFGKYFGKMTGNDRFVPPKQSGNLIKASPYRFRSGIGPKLDCSVLGLVYDGGIFLFHGFRGEMISDIIRTCWPRPKKNRRNVEAVARDMEPTSENT